MRTLKSRLRKTRIWAEFQKSIPIHQWRIVPNTHETRSVTTDPVVSTPGGKQLCVCHQQFTYMVIGGCADGSFDSVQMWLNGLHVHRVLTSTHLQNQLEQQKQWSWFIKTNVALYLRSFLCLSAVFDLLLLCTPDLEGNIWNKHVDKWDSILTSLVIYLIRLSVLALTLNKYQKPVHTSPQYDWPWPWVPGWAEPSDCSSSALGPLPSPW